MGVLEGRGVAAPALLLALIHRSAWNGDSRKFISKILHRGAPVPLKSPSPDTPRSPSPVPLVTPMDRYACVWMLSVYKQRLGRQHIRPSCLVLLRCTRRREERTARSKIDQKGDRCTGGEWLQVRHATTGRRLLRRDP